ncbi:MAG TPA: CRISPR-associated endonuclease Cas3'' [Syntrophomonas sp.]|nr:CRISPR-associated endonuclease Cas3'' [Syntrophomonas sp.]
MYYAHSPKGGVPPQTYLSHVEGVRDRAREYVQALYRYAKLDGKLLSQISDKVAVIHDLGKLDSENQAVLSGEKPAERLPQNHADAGTAYFLTDKHFSVFTAAIVRAHHKGFPDFIEEQNKGEAAFRDTDIMSEVDKALPEFERIHNDLVNTSFQYENEEVKGDLSVFLRMLLSCVVDADHTDTAVHYKKYPDQVDTIPLRPAERLAQLDKYVSDLKGKDKKRNFLRREMYSACRNAVIDADVSSSDSPVGSGKTTAVMAHLLAQAEKRELRRIFVILPFTNIISQSVKTYRKALVLPGEKAEDVVAELHHRADFESEDARHLTALWRAPIIVTTAVTFFETLASNSTATLRRLHELPGSAIFIDEAHAALPAKLLPLAWRWINIYANEWNCYWILASGSLNRFWNISKIAQSSSNAGFVPEIVNHDLRVQLSCYEKNRIAYRSDLRPKDADELADWINGFKGPRLVILNTVQSAAVLAERFASRFGRNRVEHLSTALTSNDRDKTLERVINRLKNPKDTDWTLIATSCVEAGVDLSFRTGFRELGSLTSLIQAAGRINREGLFDDSEIWTFCLAEDKMLKINPGMREAAAILRGYFEGDVEIRPELSTQSIEDEIELYGLSSDYIKLVDNENEQIFPLVEKKFKVIDTDTRIVVVNQAIAERIRYGKIDWRELQKNSVQIAKYKLDELRTPEVLKDIYRWNLNYDDFLGYMAGIIQLKKFEGEAMIV